MNIRYSAGKSYNVRVLQEPIVRAPNRDLYTCYEHRGGFEERGVLEGVRGLPFPIHLLF